MAKYLKQIYYEAWAKIFVTLTKDRAMEWKDFLNPRSMLTPGIAGSVVMLIANTLWVEFSMPQKWTALILSFLLIVPILVQFAASIIENIIYFTFNGLIVFALAVNTNFAGQKIQQFSNRVDQSQTAISQPTSKSIKDALALAETSDQRKRISENSLKLALTATSTVTTETRGSSDTEASHENKDKDKNKNKDKKRDSKNRDDRQFFQQWF